MPLVRHLLSSFGLIAAVAFLFLMGLGIGEAEEVSDQPGFAYQPLIQGAPNEEIQDVLTSISDTFSMVKDPPHTAQLLESRMKGDVERFIKALNAYGYFRVKIEPKVNTQSVPAEAVFHIEAGPRFTLKNIDIRPGQDSAGSTAPLPSPKDVGLQPDQPYAATRIIEAQDKLVSSLGRQGYPEAKVTERKIVADFANNSVDVTFLVHSGPRADFGAVFFEGLKDVDEWYVQNRIPWHQGDPYDAALLGKAKSEIIRTGLFSMVNLKLGPVGSDGKVPVTVHLTERVFRTVMLGLGYESDVGLEGRFKWEHRNLWGGGQKLYASLELNEVEKTLKSGLRIPDFLSVKQTLVIDGVAHSEDTDAYDTESLSAAVALEHQFNDQAKVGAGVKYRYAKITEDDDTTEYGLLSFPLYFNWDTTDDLLDPSRGGRLYTNFAPYVDTLGESPEFAKYQIQYNHYLQLVKNKKLILAGRVMWGALTGAKREDLPRDELFYVGGGGSVRGYEYQYAGDMTRNKDGDLEPEGGMSAIEVSAELRFKITKTFGLVGFIDGGRANATERIDWEEGLFWGTGLGIRYYTPIGPVRLDVAVPLDKRDDIDEDFQIYIGLGQAF